MSEEGKKVLKQAAKPKHSPLPASPPAEQVTDERLAQWIVDFSNREHFDMPGVANALRHYQRLRSQPGEREALTPAQRNAVLCGIAALEQFPTRRTAEHERNLRDAATLRSMARERE